MSIMRQYLAKGLINFGGRIVLRDVRPDDGAIVAYWRNTPQARSAFYNTAVVTPLTHYLFLQERKPYDMIWMAINAEYDPVGMTAITIEPEGRTGEYGRTFVDPAYQGRGYATEIEYMVLVIGFELYQLQLLWLDAYADNIPILRLHEKTGWRYANDPAHAFHDDRQIAHMVYDRGMWGERRARVCEEMGWQLPEWQP